MVQQAIVAAIESWVENGRQRDAIRDGRTFVLRFGRRFKLVQLANFAIFFFGFGLGIVVLLQGDRTAIILLSVALGGLLSVLSATYVIYLFTSRVIIDDTRVVVRCFGMAISECTAETLSTAYKSSKHRSIVLQCQSGKKTRISTQFDGLQSLVAWLRLRPQSTLTGSIIYWMAAEAPDLDEPSDEDRDF